MHNWIIFSKEIVSSDSSSYNNNHYNDVKMIFY